jgi:hypothetical protein
MMAIRFTFDYTPLILCGCFVRFDHILLLLDELRKKYGVLLGWTFAHILRSLIFSAGVFRNAAVRAWMTRVQRTWLLGRTKGLVLFGREGIPLVGYLLDGGGTDWLKIDLTWPRLGGFGRGVNVVCLRD